MPAQFSFDALCSFWSSSVNGPSWSLVQWLGNAYLYQVDRSLQSLIAPLARLEESIGLPVGHLTFTVPTQRQCQLSRCRSRYQICPNDCTIPFIILTRAHLPSQTFPISGGTRTDTLNGRLIHIIDNCKRH